MHHVQRLILIIFKDLTAATCGRKMHIPFRLYAAARNNNTILFTEEEKTYERVTNSTSN